jgi:hypothetical protein
MASLFGGQLREKTFTVTSDRRALSFARFVAGHALPGLVVETITASHGDCRVDAVLGGVCDFVDLQPFTSLTVTVTYRAAEGSWLADPVVNVSVECQLQRHQRVAL